MDFSPVLIMIMKILIYLQLLQIGIAFSISRTNQLAERKNVQPHMCSSLSMALGDITASLKKPLGIILEERKAGEPGVRIKSMIKDGAAASSGTIAPGDILLRVGNQDVSQSDFDSIMIILTSSEAEYLELTLGDRLGKMDIAPNLAKQLSNEEALLADKTVRSAVKEIRKFGKLGDLMYVEIVIGAGIQVRENNIKRCSVRFFAIFSKDDGGSTYSCNVSATGLHGKNGVVNLVGLSCAKDEGFGQTVDLILE